MEITIRSAWMTEELLDEDIWLRIYELAEEYYHFNVRRIWLEHGHLTWPYGNGPDCYICLTRMSPKTDYWYIRPTAELECAIERYSDEVSHIFAELSKPDESGRSKLLDPKDWTLAYDEYDGE